MAWPRPAQRVLLVASAVVLLGSVLEMRRTPPKVGTPAPADPTLDLRVDLNRAAQAELEALPGIGPALAGRILAHRAARGRFHSLDDLREVPGLREATVRRIAPLLRVR